MGELRERPGRRRGSDPRGRELGAAEGSDAARVAHLSPSQRRVPRRAVLDNSPGTCLSPLPYTAHLCALRDLQADLSSTYRSAFGTQLIYLLKHTKGYIHSIYGPHEPLLYPNGLDKLILSLDLSLSTITFVSKPALLTSLGHISEEQFLDFGLLSGCEGSLPFPPLIPNGVKALVDSLKQFKSGSEILRAYLSDPQVKELSYSDLYMRARSAIKFALVFTGDEGRCVPLPLALAHQNSITAADIPQDMHELFSHRLPDEVYFHLARGLVSPQLLGWLTSGLVVEDPPLDNGDSTEYRRFVQEVVTEGFTSPRCTALALVSSVLIPGFWPKRKVVRLLSVPPFSLSLSPAGRGLTVSPCCLPLSP